MGQTQVPPLSLILNHFKDFRDRARRFGLKVKKEKVFVFCTNEWPTFGTGWPEEGTFDLLTIYRTKEIIVERPNHLNQIAYIMAWQVLVESPPKWVKSFLASQQSSETVLALHEREQNKELPKPSGPLYPVLQGVTEDLLLSPTPMPEQSSTSGIPERAGGANIRSSPHTRGSTIREEPQAPITDCTILPLRAIRPPDKDGNQLLEYWPFSTTDLYTWKLMNPKFSEKPGDLIQFFDSIFFTHQPTWDDCQQLLQIFFTTEERERIISKALKLVPGVNGNPTTDQALIDSAFPLKRPDWDFYTTEGQERLKVYRQTLLAGLRAAVPWRTNSAKVSHIQQEKTESPGTFLARIMEAMYLEAPESKSSVITAFIYQAAPDIRQELQKIDNPALKSLSELIMVAERVYNKRLEDKLMKANKMHTYTMAEILRALTADSPEEKIRLLRHLAEDKSKRTSSERRPRLQRNQCAYCKEMGHWVKDCPKKLPNKGQYPERAHMLELGEFSD